MRFNKGDRVRLSSVGLQRNISRVNTGVVARQPQNEKDCIAVLCDGNKYPTYFHESFWELDNGGSIVLPDGKVIPHL